MAASLRCSVSCHARCWCNAAAERRPKLRLYFFGSRNGVIIAGMRILGASFVVVLVWGCGGNDAPRPADKHDKVARDAGTDGATATTDDMTQLETVLAGAFDQFDRGNKAKCVCAAEMGAYGSTEECFELVMSGPDWVSCSAHALADMNTPELRERGRCYTKLLSDRADCDEATTCGSPENQACGAITSECAVLDAPTTVLISQQCPDTTILARLN
jgi:hypothetical protein